MQQLLEEPLLFNFRIVQLLFGIYSHQVILLFAVSLLDIEQQLMLLTLMINTLYLLQETGQSRYQNVLLKLLQLAQLIECM